MIVAESVTFRRPDVVGGQEITIPPGATSDGASIPQPLWSVGLTPFGPWWLPCVLHDALYRRQTNPPIDDRSLADLILWEAMVACNVPEPTARLIYTAVSQAGQSAWDDDRKEKV